VSPSDGWRRVIGEIDLHVVAVVASLVAAGLVLIVPVVGLGLRPRLWVWYQLALLVVPQGLILTRGLSDSPSIGRPAGPYLVANEGVVLAGCLLHLLLGSLVARVVSAVVGY
jgi:hypothetical protein